MQVKIHIDKVWGKDRQDRVGVVVEIQNDDQVFKFMPTYKHLADIYTKLVLAETLNRDRALNPIILDN